MWNETFSCDGLCGAEKKEGNRWTVLFVGPTQFLAIPWEHAVEAGSVRDGKHICGQECAHKLLSQWLEATSLSSASGQHAGCATPTQSTEGADDHGSSPSNLAE